MANAKPFSISTFQDLFNDSKNTPMQGVLGLAVELWTFGNPGGLQTSNFSKCWASPPHLVKVGLRHQESSNYALTNFFGLCKFVWIIDPFATHLNPHPKAPARPYTPKVLWTRKCTPTPSPSAIFNFGLVIKFIKEFGGASYIRQSLSGEFGLPIL